MIQFQELKINEIIKERINPRNNKQINTACLAKIKTLFK